MDELIHKMFNLAAWVIPLGILALIIINLVITFSLSGISIGGHLGGLVGGIVLMLLYLQFRANAALCIASAVGVAVASVVVAYAVI